MPEQKVCSRCGLLLPLDGFHKSKLGKHGRNSVCKSCLSVYNKRYHAEYYKLHREHCIESVRTYREENRDKISIARREKSISRPMYKSAIRYKVSEQLLNELFESCNGVCQICNSKEASHNLCVDHCHTTGSVRGIVCKKCNILLGAYERYTAVADTVLNYLHDTSVQKFIESHKSEVSRNERNIYDVVEDRQLFSIGKRRCIDCGEVLSISHFRSRSSGGYLCYDRFCKCCLGVRQSKQNRSKIYGIPVRVLDSMIKEFGLSCMVCHKTLFLTSKESGRSSAMAIDHDHGTGVVRGIVCMECNKLLMAYDWAMSLGGAVENYLSRPKIGDSILDVK